MKSIYASLALCLLVFAVVQPGTSAQEADVLVEDNTPGHWMTDLLGEDGNDQLAATRGSMASHDSDAQLTATSEHDEDAGNDVDEESQEDSDKRDSEREASAEHDDDDEDDDDDDDESEEHEDGDDDSDDEGAHIPDTFLEEPEDENGHSVDTALETSDEDDDDDSELNGSEQDDEMNGVSSPAVSGDNADGDAGEAMLSTGAQTEAEAQTAASWKMSARQKRLLAKARQKARLAKQKAKNQRFRSIMAGSVQRYARRAVRRQIKWFIDNYLDKDAVALARPFHRKPVPSHKLDVEPGPGPQDPEPWNTATRKPDSPATVDGGIKNPGTITEVNKDAHVAAFPPKTQ